VGCIWAILLLITSIRSIFFGTYAHLDQYEGNFEDLKEVIVFVDTLQEPQGVLREAVIKNLGAGVKYLFFISKSKTTEDSLTRIKATFESLAKTTNSSYTGNGLIDIKYFDDDWTSAPLVFYRSSNTDRDAKYKTFAFCGTEKDASIANAYESLSPTIAKALAGALNSGASDAIKPVLAALENDEFSLVDRANKNLTANRNLIMRS
jgi:hypothetical protein